MPTICNGLLRDSSSWLASQGYLLVLWGSCIFTAGPRIHCFLCSVRLLLAPRLLSQYSPTCVSVVGLGQLLTPSVLVSALLSSSPFWCLENDLYRIGRELQWLWSTCVSWGGSSKQANRLAGQLTHGETLTSCTRRVPVIP